MISKSQLRRFAIQGVRRVKLEVGDWVRILKYPEDSNNGHGRVDHLLPDGRVFVENQSHPFLGSVHEYFQPEDLEIRESRRTE